MVEIKAPQFPESIADGEVAIWRVGIGEAVRRDEVLVEIETDKVVLEVVAPADGVMVSINKAEGETVLAEEVLGEFDASEVSVGVSVEPDNEVSGSAIDEQSHQGDPRETIASPAARKMAVENKIQVDDIDGTGKDGRVTKEDVLNAVALVEGQNTKELSSPINAPSSGLKNERIERRVPMTRLRASIARRLVEAQQTAAILTTFNEIDMSNIFRIRFI